MKGYGSPKKLEIRGKCLEMQGNRYDYYIRVLLPNGLTIEIKLLNCESTLIFRQFMVYVCVCCLFSNCAVDVSDLQKDDKQVTARCTSEDFIEILAVTVLLRLRLL